MPSPVRWRVLGVYWLAQALLLYTVFSAFETTDGLTEMPDSLSAFVLGLGDLAMTRDGVFVLSGIALFTMLQALFVTPVRKPMAGRRGPGVWWSLAVAGLMIGLLTSSLVIALAEAFVTPDDELFSGSFPPPSVVLWGSMAFGWVVATPLLIAFCRRGRRESVLSRISAWLFLGTVVEVVAIIPLDVLVRRRNPCYCATGTYWGLVMCGIVGLFVLGPMVFLPLVHARRKRWYGSRCEVCGYDMTGLESPDRCPECGAGWRA